MAGGNSSKAGDREAEARLLSFCRRSVADAAADAWAQHADAIERAVDGGGAALTPEGSSWDEVRTAMLIWSVSRDHCVAPDSTLATVCPAVRHLIYHWQGTRCRCTICRPALPGALTSFQAWRNSCSERQGSMRACLHRSKCI